MLAVGTSWREGSYSPCGRSFQVSLIWYKKPTADPDPEFDVQKLRKNLQLKFCDIFFASTDNLSLVSFHKGCRSHGSKRSLQPWKENIHDPALQNMLNFFLFLRIIFRPFWIRIRIRNNVKSRYWKRIKQFFNSWIDISTWNFYLTRTVSSVAGPHHLGADPNPVFHFDADPDPTFYSDAYPDLTFKFIRIRIPPLFSPDLEPLMLHNNPPRLPPFHFDADPDPAFHFDADPEPAFHFDAYGIRIFNTDS